MINEILTEIRNKSYNYINDCLRVVIFIMKLGNKYFNLKLTLLAWIN